MRHLKEESVSSRGAKELEDMQRETRAEKKRQEKLKDPQYILDQEKLRLKQKQEKRKRKWQKFVINQAAAKTRSGGGDKINPEDTSSQATTKLLQNIAGSFGNLPQRNKKKKKNKLKPENQSNTSNSQPEGSSINQSPSFVPSAPTFSLRGTRPTRSLPPSRKRLQPSGGIPAGSLPKSTKLTRDNSPRTGLSLGQRARRNPQLRQKLIQSRMEEYSNWRQELLLELGEMRKEDNKKIIKPMKGKNKIICMPNDPDKMSEDYLYETTNNSSIFAKATPPLKRRTTPMSDIVLSNQPGKGSAEKVRDVMARLFLGDRRNYYPNYDLSGHKSDGSDTDSSRVKNESYNDSGFRQHSMSIGEGPTKEGTRTKSTAKVLAAMAALNAKKSPSKKKKKKDKV